ncbi:hypothetical protein C0992_012120, partial [Termitomyces sp. T32_za158]
IITYYAHTAILVSMLERLGSRTGQKKHKGSKKCNKNLKKWQEAQITKKTQSNAASFFTQKAPHVLPTVSAPLVIHSTLLPLINVNSTPITCSEAKHLLHTFQKKILALPKTIEVADSNHPLAAFAGNPMGCVGDDEDAWEKWDGLLNTQLQKTLDELHFLVQRGENRLIGLHRFLAYLVVYHGIKEVLIEEKLSRVMDYIDK